MADDTDLWSVHAPSDDYIPVPSYDDGEQLARMLNNVLSLVAGVMPDPPATVQPWPHTPEDHQRLVAEDQW